MAAMSPESERNALLCTAWSDWPEEGGQRRAKFQQVRTDLEQRVLERFKRAPLTQLG